jgi:hypothetical protein
MIDRKFGEGGAINQRTVSETTPQTESRLHNTAQQEDEFATVEVCEPTEEEKETPRTEGKSRHEPLKPVLRDVQVSTDRWQSHGHGGGASDL